MNLSLLTFSFQQEALTRQMTAQKLCAIAKENHLSMLDMMESEIKLYGVKNLKKAFQETGITCGCVISSMPFYQKVDQFPVKLTKVLSLCKEIGAGSLMIVPGSFDKRGTQLLRKEEIKRRAIELFTMAVNRGKELGIEILFEDTPQAYKPLSSAKDCLEVLKAVPGLGFVFDTANFLVSEPDFDILADYALLKDHIRRVHVKDVAYGPFVHAEECENGNSIRCVATGSGVIDLRSFIEKLKEDGYEGVLSLEYAATPTVHGEDHGKYISTYVTLVQAYLDGQEVHPSYGKIPGIDKPVSKVFFGTAIMPMLMGKNMFGLLDAALSYGINAFDCARGYGNAEKVLGRWIKERNNREKVVLLTKCGNVNMKGEVHVNREVIESELKTSLATLGVDYIDIYLLHRDDPATPVSEFIDTLNDLKAQGKIRVFGVSNWTHERIQAANEYAKEKGLEGFTVSSPNYGLARQMQDPWGGDCVTVAGPENQGARQWYAQQGMPVLCYSSLARGFFSGKFKSFDYEGAKKVLDGPSRKGYLYEENMRRLRNAEALAAEKGTSVSDIALRYVFGSDMNTFAIVSTTNPKRLWMNVQSSLQPLSAEEIQALEKDEA